jgi:hypothetical protein
MFSPSNQDFFCKISKNLHIGDAGGAIIIRLSHPFARIAGTNGHGFIRKPSFWRGNADIYSI